MKAKLNFLFIVFVSVAIYSPHAATITWTNTSGGDWSVTNNWTPNQVPGLSDDAVITASGIYIVTLDVSPTVNSLTLGGSSGQQTLTTAGQNLILNNASVVNANGIFGLSGGSFGGSGLLTVKGQLNWSSGTITAGSYVTVATNGLLTAAFGGNQYICYGVLTNAGTVQVASATPFTLNGNGSTGGLLVNLPGALVNVQEDGTLFTSTGNELILNEGTFRKSAGTGTLSITPTFDNPGTLDVQSGTVSMDNSGKGSGQFLPEAGTTLVFPQSYEVDSALTGAGTNLLTGGTFTLNGNINGSNVFLVGATLLASNTMINSALTWNSGTITAGSYVTVATNGLLTAAFGGNQYICYGVLTNAGTVQVASATPFTLNGNGSTGGLLVNLPGALVNVQEDGTLFTSTGNELILNEGTFRKSAGTGTLSITPTFDNPGTLDVQSGTVSMDNSGKGSGQFLPEAGTTLVFPQSYEVDSALTGAGTNLLTGGTFTLNGNINGSNVFLVGATLLASNTMINSALTWNSGTITAGSYVTVATNGLLTAAFGGNQYICYGVLTNAGTVQVASATPFTLNGNGSTGGLLVNLPGALVNVQEDGTLFTSTGNELILNEGTFRKSAGTGTLSITPTFDNPGTLDVQSGTVSMDNSGKGSGQFLPEAGTTLVFPQSYEVDSALTGAGTNLLTGGTFTLNGNINGSNVFLVGATLLASNTMINSALTWNSGTITAGSYVTVATNGLLTAAFGGNQYICYGVLTNAGTVQVASATPFTLNGNGSTGGLLVNLPGALVNVQEDGTLFTSTGNELILNEGTFRKSAGTGTLSITPTFDNPGTLDVQSGTVSMDNSGKGSGQFLPEAGTTLVFPQSYEVDSALTGAGTNLLTGGTFTLNGNINGSNVFLVGATLLASNTMINSALTWNSGTITAGSYVTVATNGLLTAAFGGNQYICYGVLTNAGTVQVASATPFTLNGNGSTGGLLVNLPGALVNVQEDGTLFTSTGNELILNEGTFRKSAGTGTLSITPTFDNPGTLDVQSGTVSLNGSYSLTNGTLNFGISSSTNFGMVNLPGAAVITGSLSANFNAGFLPGVTNSWQIINYTTLSGAFSKTNLPPVAVWQVTTNSTSLTITVQKLVPQLTWINPANIVYGTALTASQLDATAKWNGSVVSGSYNYTPPLGTVLQSGSNQTLSVSFAPIDTTDYTNATAAVPINALKAPMGVTATNRSKTYGQNITFAGTEFVAAGLVNGDTVTSASLASAGAISNAPVTGSPYAIAISNAQGDAGLTNYIIAYTNGLLTVNKAALGITAANRSKTYGQNITFAGTEFTSSGLQNLETTGTVTLTSAGAISNAPVSGSPYSIIPSAATGGTFAPGNYTIGYTNGALSVNEAPLTITANSTNKIAGETLTFAGTQFTASGLQNTETIGTVTLTSAGAASSAAAGPYNIVPSAPVGGTFSQGNYSDIFVDGTLTVLGAPELTLTALGNQYVLSFPSVSGQIYQLRSRTNLTIAGWSTLGGTMNGTGGTMNVTNSIAGPQSFFQLQIMP